MSALEASQRHRRQQAIAAEVISERDRQDAKFGPQWELPLVGNPETHRYYGEMASTFKVINGRTARDYAGMLLEEVYEALSESDPARMRAELIQVAAVVMKMIEKIDRESGA